MPAYKNFYPLGPTDTKPWGLGDLNNEKDIIDTLVGDTLAGVKDLTGHKHRTLYDGYGYQTVTSDDGTKIISIGRNDYPHRIEMNVRTDSATALRMRSGGYSFMQYDSPHKTIKLGEAGGDHLVDIQLGYGTPSFIARKTGGSYAFKWDDGTQKFSVSGAFAATGEVRADGDIYTQPWSNITSSCVIGGFASTANLWIWSRKIGSEITILFRVEGTSNQIYFTIQIPYNVTNLGFDAAYQPFQTTIKTIDNSVHSNYPGMAVASGTYITCYKNYKYTAGGDWTAANYKAALGMITFTGADVP